MRDGDRVAILVCERLQLANIMIVRREKRKIDFAVASLYVLLDRLSFSRL